MKDHTGLRSSELSVSRLLQLAAVEGVEESLVEVCCSRWFLLIIIFVVFSLFYAQGPSEATEVSCYEQESLRYSLSLCTDWLAVVDVA